MALDAEIYSYVSRELQIPFLKMAGRLAAGLEAGDQLATFCILFIMAGYLWQKPRLVKTFTGGLFALGAGGIAVQALKHLIGRARPSKGLGDFYFIGPHLWPSGFDAFPSGHTTALFALLAFFCRYYPHWTIPLYSAGFLLALLGRVITGQHFFTDVIGGAILGSAVGIVVAGGVRRAVESSFAPAIDPSPPEETKIAKPAPRAARGAPLFTETAIVVVFSSAALLTAGRAELFSNLQPALYGILSAMATYFLARELCGKDMALYSAIIVSSSFLFVSVSRLLPSDAAWILFTVLAFLAYVYSAKRGPTSNLLLVMSYAALGLGFLAKGPIALFPVLVFLIHEQLQENSLVGFLSRSALRHGLLLAFTLAVFAFWLSPGMPVREAEHAFFFDDAAARTGLTRHAGKVIYYLPVLALALFPWTFFAISYFVKEGRRWLRETTIDLHSRLLLLWAAVVIALFPFVAAKFPHTIVLALPPLSCLLARFIKREISPGALKFSLLATIAAAAGLSIGAVVVPIGRPEYSTLKLAVPFVLLTFFLVTAWILKNRERSEAMFAAICLGALGFYMTATLIAP
ncbi:MAG TPA: phosphatase PAP2 family protein [Candidatus Binatia bacterium]|jgi:membrane-associated phospholipid phosphatase